MSARDEVLARVRQALADVPAAEQPDDVAVERAYTRTLGLAPDEVVARFVERARRLRRRRPARRPRRRGDDDRRGAERCTVRAASAFRPTFRRPCDRPGSSSSRTTGLPTRGRDGLEGLDGVLTTCSVAIAETGTICLAGGVGDGRRALTLVPDLHVCVVPVERIVGSVPEGIEALGGAARAGRPITLASGPSATSDIEMNRVAGVHGPRRLVVVLVG